MANIKLGALVQDVRGSQNGLVFSRNKGGAYVRTKVSPVQPVSPFSDAARAAFKAITQAWATELTDAQRAGWIAFAATHTYINVFGDAITLSGIAMYNAVNLLNTQLGFDRIDEPPATFDAAAISLATGGATYTGTALDSMGITPTLSRALNADETFVFEATPPFSAGRIVQKNQYRIINTRSGGLLTSLATLLPLYNVRYDTPSYIFPQNIAYRIAVLNTATGAVGVGVSGYFGLSET